MPTTCVWVEKDGIAVVRIRRLQYVVLTVVGAAWAITLDVLGATPPGVTGTFMGGLVGHVTSWSIWVQESNGYMTTLCPGNFNARAWGSNPKNKKKKERKKKKGKDSGRKKSRN